MHTKKLLFTLVIFMALLGACTGQPQSTPQETSSTPSPTVIPVVPSPEIKENPPTPTPAPTTTSTPSSTPTGPYTGPLFDAHLYLGNMYMGTPAQLSSMKLKSAGDLLSYLDRNKIEGAIGFYYFEKDKSGSFVSTAEAIIRGTRGRVIPILQPSQGQLNSGQYNEAVLRQYLQPQGLLQGVGEVALYWLGSLSVTLDSPIMQTVFQVVNELKGIVMIHPSTMGMGGRLTELAEIEPSIRKYPDAIFLFHGNAEVFNLVAQLMSKYPNVYFSIDAQIFYSRLLGYNLLAGPNTAVNTAERFLADINRIGSDRLVEDSLESLWAKLQQYPDRIIWGTDLLDPWQLEESVTDMVIKISRQLIGRLPADVQEKYAYKNAQRVFGRFLTPNP
jgi:hypothetical protein